MPISLKVQTTKRTYTNNFPFDFRRIKKAASM